MSKVVEVLVGARVQVRVGPGEWVDLSGKTAVVVALVALEGEADRRQAAQMLWPQSPAGQARNNLRTLVHRLHQRVGVELLGSAERLRLDPAVAQLQPGSGDALLVALNTSGLQGTELLAQAGVEADASEALQQWLQAARAQQRRQQLAVLSAALNAALERAEAQHAIALARGCLQLEPLSEQWHRQLMDTLARCGDRAAALAAYEDCKERLRQQLGVLPDLQTRTVQLRILQEQAVAPSQRGPGAQAAPPSVAAGLTPLGGAARYPLVEREAVLAEVNAALAQGLHVVLHGEAGVGKTRLLRHLGEGAAFEQVAVRLGARGEPYAALAHLLQEVQPRRSPRIGLPEQVELARLAPLAFAGVQPSQASLSAPRLHAALRHWAARLRDAGVQQLMLDDLHHADAASQAAFASLLSDPDSAPVPALLLAHRSGEIEPVLAEAMAGAQGHGLLTSISLPRLTLHGVQVLLEAMHVDRPEARAQELLQRTGGNPLFVIELTRHAMENAATASSAAGNLGALLRARLGAASAAAQQLAALAAVAAQDFSVELAEDVTRQPALAMMPAWSELQQRGLFADHGLAHDLVRDAALAEMPPAIARKLHRDVARHLEDRDRKGASVLLHWLAAQDFDRALPHLAHQLHATNATGLPTLQIEKDLLKLMGCLGDVALLDNLWLTAEIDGSVRSADVLRTEWPALASLITRVERMKRPAAAERWLAFERARLLEARDGRRDQGYAMLSEVANGMAEIGIERAWVETRLALFSYYLNGKVYEHVTRAKAAVAGLAGQPRHANLLRTVDFLHAFVFDLADSLRAKMSARRAARKRHDLAAVEALKLDIARQCLNRGCAASAYRCFSVDVRAQWSDARLLGEGGDSFFFGIAAMRVGRYAKALRFLGLMNENFPTWMSSLYQAAMWVHTGQWSRARTLLDSIGVKSLAALSIYLRDYLFLRRAVDLHTGTNPLAGVRELVDMARQAGVGGVVGRLFEWQVVLLTADAPERLAIGTRLLADMSDSRMDTRERTRLLLDVAEAQAQAGRADGHGLALEAARELRRGRAPATVYLPDALCRCAALLETTEPKESAALRHVARRWVQTALPHVPDVARQSFVSEVPVNRWLLTGGT